MIGGGGHELEAEVPLNLTALLDVMVNLLFFLLLGTATQLPPLDVDPQLQLPTSTAAAPPQGGLQLEIGARAVRLDQHQVAQHQAGQLQEEAADAGVPGAALTRALLAWRQRHAPLSKQQEVVVLLCDRQVDYGLMQQIMQRAAAAGFVRFHVAANEDSQL